MGIVTVEKLENADKDADALEKFISGSDTENVKTRKAKEYPTLANAVRQVIETGGFEPFSTEVELLASIPILEKKAAKALDTKKVWLWDGREWKDTGSSEYDLAKKEIDAEILLRETLINTGIDLFKDKWGFVFAEVLASAFKFNIPIVSNTISTEEVTISDNNDSTVKFRDKYGFFFDLNDILQVFNVEEYIPIDVLKPLFSRKFAYWKDEPFYIDVPSLLKEKQRQLISASAQASLSSLYEPFSTTSDRLLFVDEFSKLGTQFLLTLRDKSEFTNRTQLLINAIQVETNKSVEKTIKLHSIGDSILNRGGLFYIQKYLKQHGFNATCIGTMKAADDTNASTTEGLYAGEAREGWETGDFTYQVTDRVKIVKAGDEITYQAYPKNNDDGLNKWTHNPYLRLATEQDNIDFVRNGYVFDFGYYLTRFNLETPELIYIGLGTNDIRDKDMPILETDFYDNMKIMISQIRSFVPNIPILLALPGTAVDKSRNELWSTEYFYLIRVLQRIVNEFTNIILIPTWAIAPQEGSYSWSGGVISTDSISGATYGALADSIHPTMASRFQLADFIAANIASFIK